MGSHNYFKWQKNKFDKLVKNWMKYKLDPDFKNHLWQTQSEIQVWLVTLLLPHTPNIFSSVLDDYKNGLWEEWRGLFLQSPPWRRPWALVDTF